MKKQDLEYRVLSIIERLQKGQPIEDDIVELKSEWPREHHRAARRIAGHANAARGEPVLWLIGIDEKAGVVGADFEELSTWFARVKSRFDGGLAPHMTSLAIPYEDKTVVALLFETDRAPFVVKNPEGTGTISHEIPWREANSTRSARRADLIKLLYPIQKNPKIEILEGMLVLMKGTGGGSANNNYQWTLDLKLYLTTHSSDQVVIPFHRCRAIIREENSKYEVSCDKIRISPPITFQAMGLREKKQSLTVSSTDHEAIINTAGMIFFSAEAMAATFPENSLADQIRVKAVISPHHTEVPVILEPVFRYDEAAKSEEESNRVVARWICTDSVDS